MVTIQSFVQFIDYIFVFLKWSWPFLLLIWMFVMKKIWGRFPIEAVIIEKRGENLIKTNDRLGRFRDEGDIIGYKFHKSKDTIQIANYDWIIHNVFVPNTLLERLVALLRGNIGTLFLFKYGSKQYKPIQIKTKEGIKKVFKEIKGKDGKSVWVNIYQPIDPRDKLGALNFAVMDWDNINFMTQEMRASILRRRKKNELLKSLIVPIAAFAVTALICMFLIKFSYDWASEMRSLKIQSCEDITASGDPPTPAEPPNIPVISDVISPG